MVIDVESTCTARDVAIDCSDYRKPGRCLFVKRYITAVYAARGNLTKVYMAVIILESVTMA
jgi:hypothetical protein